MKNKNVTIEIWKKIPKWYKTLLFGVIGLSVINYLLNNFLEGRYDFLTDELIIVCLGIIALIVLGFFIGLLSVINNLLNVTNSDQKIETQKSNVIKQKKKISDFIELEIISIKGIEYSIKAFRCFNVDDKPGADTFLKSITIYPINCNVCKNKLYFVPEKGTLARTPAYIWTCNNRSCSNYFKTIFDKYEFNELTEQFKLQTTTKIKMDFNKYWDKYCEVYEKFTDGKSNEFEDVHWLGDLEVYLKKLL